MSSDAMAAEYRSVAKDPSLAPKVREAAMLLSAAEQHLNSEDGEEALSTAKSSLAIFREVKEPAGEADALRAVVSAHCKLGEGEDALRVANEELAKFRSAGERRGEGSMLLSVAEASGKAKRKAKALEPALQAIGIFRELGDRKMEAKAQAALIDIHVERAHRGALDAEAKEAVQVGEGAVALFREFGDKVAEAKALHSLALAHVCLSSAAEAAKCSKASIALWQELGDKKQQAAGLTSLSAMHMEQKNKKAAVESAQQAIDMLEELEGEKTMQVAAYVAQVKAYSAEQDYAKAIEVAEDGCAKFEKSRDSVEAAGVLEALVEAYVAKSDNAEAIETADRLFALLKDARRTGPAARRLEARVLRIVGRIHNDEGRFTEADKALTEAVAIADELDDGEEKATYLIALSNAKAGLKDHTEAFAKANQARDILRRLRHRRAEATAFLNLCSMHAARGVLQKAVIMGKEAQIIFSRMGAKQGEVDAIFMLAQICIAGGAQELAMRLARRGRELLQEIGNEEDEFAMVGLSVRAAFLSASKDGGCWKDGKITPVWDGVLAMAKEAMTLAKRIGDDEIVAHGSFILGQTHLMRGEFELAQKHIDDSTKICQKKGDVRAEAQTHLTVAQMRIMQQRNDEAKSLLERTKEMFEGAEDAEGAQISQELLDFIAGVPTIKPQPQVQEVSAADSAAGGAVAVYEGPSEEQVVVAVTDVALSLIGVDGLDGDTPLMDAGLDSLASVEFQNTLQKEFQGVQLPSTLIFDFPSVKTISEFIHTGLVEASGASE